MATFTATRGASDFPRYVGRGGGTKQVAYGTIEVAANPVAADIYQMCWVPANATILGGMIYADDSLETNATPTLDLDLGWAANGGSGTYDAIDADGLGNVGPWDDAVNTGGGGRIIATHSMQVFGPHLDAGDLPTFTEDTLIQFTCVATSATFAAGALTVVIDYVTP